MATGTRHDLIHCEHCGEDYSATYKRCPFCDERAGGTHNNTRGGGYSSGITPGQIVGLVISVAFIALAIYIVFYLVAPLIGVGQGTNEPDPTPPIEASPDTTPDNTANPDATTSPDNTANPDSTTSPDTTPDVTPTPDNTQTSSNVTAISLNREDFSLSEAGESFRMVATLTPADAAATVVWESSDPTIARVSAEGVVTAIGNGNATITASVGSVSADCIVRVKNQSASSNTGGNATTPGTTYKLSHEDVSITVGETFTIRLKDATGVTWSSADTSKVTVDANGKVTGVAKGTVNITGTLNGETYTCIVRVK